MTDNNEAQFPMEGAPILPTVDTEKVNSAESQPGKETTTENTPSSEGDGTNNTQPKDNKDRGFADDPRWQARETSWNNRFNEQEKRHQATLQKAIEDVKKEFSQARKDNAKNTEIPKWFGGDQEAWDAFREHEETRLKEAEERAYKRVSEAQNQQKEAEQTHLKEANDYFASEVTAIEADTEINPGGEKVDVNKLVKFVSDNHSKIPLVDQQGRWMWRTAFAIMQARNASAGSAPAPADRKRIAGATNASDSSAEKTNTTFKTPADFKKSKPW